MMTMTTEPPAPRHETTDLGFAAFLMTMGCVLTRIAGPVGSRRRFVFEHIPPKLVNDYFNGGSVPARTFANTLRDLKAHLRA
jgi:hypothetical protein